MGHGWPPTSAGMLEEVRPTDRGVAWCDNEAEGESGSKIALNESRMAHCQVEWSHRLTNPTYRPNSSQAAQISAVGATWESG